MSGTLLSIILSFRWAYARSKSFRVTRSTEGQTENFTFEGRDHVLGQFSINNAKMALERFLNGPNRKKMKIKKCRNSREQRGRLNFFPPSKYQNSVIFEDIYLTFCTHIDLRGFSNIYCDLWKLENFLWRFLKIMPICIAYFQKFHNFKTVKIWVWLKSSFSIFCWELIGSIS